MLWVDRVRLRELEAIADVLQSTLKKESKMLTLVEIGGGSGFLAKQLSDMGFQVLSYDPSPRAPAYFPVEMAYGHELPLDGGVADVVFSAHTLEHIPYAFLGDTFQEIRRILKPSGEVIIFLPSSAAMLCTIMLQPVGNLIRVIGYVRRKMCGGETAGETRSNNPLMPRQESFRAKLLKGLTLRWCVPAAHGVGKSAFHEVLNWRRSRWIKVFAAFGFDVIEVRKSGFAVSHHQIFGNYVWPLRTALGKLGVSGTHIFRLKCTN